MASSTKAIGRAAPTPEPGQRRVDGIGHRGAERGEDAGAMTRRQRVAHHHRGRRARGEDEHERGGAR